MSGQIIPPSCCDTGDPEAPLKRLAAYEQKTGGRMRAIARNGNPSNGLLFDDITLALKKSLDRDYAERPRAGSGSTRPPTPMLMGKRSRRCCPNDEFANFERWDRGSFGSVAETFDIPRCEYSREAFEFGLIGSADARTRLATTTEDNVFGKAKVFGVKPPSDGRRASRRTHILFLNLVHAALTCGTRRPAHASRFLSPNAGRQRRHTDLRGECRAAARIHRAGAGAGAA